MADDRRRRLATVRMRTTAGATIVVGVALVVGAIVLLGVLRRTATDYVETAARLRAADVVALLEAGTAPQELSVEDEEASLVQVLDDNGSVVASSGNVEGERPIAETRPGTARTVRRLPIDDGEDSYRVVAAAARTPKGSFIVLTARSLEPVDTSVRAVAAALAAGLPLLVMLVGFTTWMVTGRSLRPVEAIRAEVTSITNEQLGRRVPEPRGDDEIARLARTMNEMLERLEMSRDRQQRFVSDAGHEMRSPIATLRHGLELMIADPGDDVAERARELLREDMRLEALVEDLLLLARSDEGGLGRTHQPVDLDDILLSEAVRLRAIDSVRIDASGISAGRVIGDRTQLARAVRNLVDNAERHATAKVTLSLSKRGGSVELTVADDGTGIAPPDRERIFERFTRLDTARGRRTGGYGLGLAIVRQIVTSHQGTVRVEENPGGGARFVVDFPAAGT